MAKSKEKQAKPKTGLARCMELASNKKGLVFLAAVLSSLAAIASFIPYIAVYLIIRSIIQVYPELGLLEIGTVTKYAWMALGGIIANILLYFLAIFSSHMAAFGTLYELKVHFADHITKIPLGYHLTIGSGRLRKIMDENIESVEGFIAHQFPDFVASITAPIVMVILLFAIDWRFGLASVVGIVLAFAAEFMGFGSGAMKENMGKYQTALEEMNNASVEYVRGMSVVKAFNQTASSFKRLKDAIGQYTEWVLKFSLGWQNFMPAFTTIINSIYLILIPVGIFIGSRTTDYKSFAMTFIFYLLFVPAIETISVIQHEMLTLASQLPEYPIVMQMFGVGPVLGPQLMAEIGDVRRFDRKQSLVAFAGVDAPPCQSGTFDSKNRHISKRGSPRLRKTLFQVLTTLIQHAPSIP